MRRAGAGLIVAAALALAGCRNTDTKAGDDKKPTGVGTGRPQGKDSLAKGPAWLNGAGTGVPKSGGPSNPNDPLFDPRTAAQDALGGRVLDSYGKPARNVFVRIEPLGAPGGPGEIGIETNNDGHFFAKGLQVGQSYEVIASATPQDGKPLAGRVQTKVPNVTLVIVLRDDLPPPIGGFPPPPKPTSDYIPPAGLTPSRQPKPPGEAWSPGGPTTGVPPATIGGARPPAVGGVTPGGSLPPPADFTPSPAPTRPENVADGPKDKFKPPPVNIPGPSNDGGPPVPPLPKLTPFNPTGGGRSSQDIRRSANAITLLDTLERPWTSDVVRPGELLLVEFVTSSCVPCKQVIPVMKSLQSRYGAGGLQVAAVLCDDLPQKERAEAAAKYGSDHNLNYALYVEPGAAGSVRDRFDVEKYPTAVLLNAGGKVLWKGHPVDRAKLEAAIKQHLGK